MFLNQWLAHSLTTFRTSAQGAGHSVGHRVHQPDGKVYEYVQFNTAAAKGAVVGYLRSGTKVKVSHLIGSSSKYNVAGVVQGSGNVAQNYGWIQKAGAGNVNMLITAGVSAGKLVFWSENSKGARPVSGTVNVAAAFAKALSNKSGGALLAGKYYLFNLT